MKIAVITLFVLFFALKANFIEEVVPEEQLKSLAKFWTAEAIAETKPMEMPVVDLKTVKLSKINAVQGGNTKPVPTPYRSKPHIYTGKLYFQTPKGRCSAPKGQWAATRVRIHSGWQRRDFARDVGAFTVASQGGKTLEQALGGKLTPIYNSAAYRDTEFLGYPGNYENGQKMIHSKGKQEFGRRANPTIKRGPSRMTFGASGGPWTVNSGSNVDSVNSFITSNPSQWIYGPSFDSEVQRVVNG